VGFPSTKNAGIGIFLQALSVAAPPGFVPGKPGRLGCLDPMDRWENLEYSAQRSRIAWIRRMIRLSRIGLGRCRQGVCYRNEGESRTVRRFTTRHLPLNEEVCLLESIAVQCLRPCCLRSSPGFPKYEGPGFPPST